MDNVFIKSSGFTQTQVNDNVSATSWNANYDGNDAKLSMNINDNGSNEHIKVRMNNEDLMKLFNFPTIQGPIDKRLRETFLRKPMVYALCNNNSSAQRPYLNVDNEDADINASIDITDPDDTLFTPEDDDDELKESFTLEEEPILNKQSSLPLKIQTVSKSSLPTLKEVSSHKSNHLSNRSSKNRSLKRSLPTLTSSKFISPDDSRDSFEPVTKQHFRTSLSLRGGKKIGKIIKKGKHKKTKKATRISTFLRRLKFI